jgi:ribA/ribD-fused uncharacterized protein
MVQEFRGQYDWASNFYTKAPFIAHNINFKSSEHYFACFKTLDSVWCQRIIDAPTPKEAKKLGKQCPLREDWSLVQVPVMAQGVWYKFSQNPDIQKKLMLTDPMKLEEGNWWHDNFWGNCRCNNKDGRHPQCLEPGKNALGQILMAFRNVFLTTGKLMAP